MPFDRLPGRINSVPQIIHAYIPPPRPIIPYGAMIAGAVDKLAGALDPLEMAKRRMALGELSLQPQKLALERAQLNRMTQLYTNGGNSNVNALDPTPQMYYNGKGGYTMESPGQGIVRAKNAALYQSSQSDASAYNRMIQEATAHKNAQQQSTQPQQYVVKPTTPFGSSIPSLQMQGPPVDLSNAVISQPKDEEDENNG